ncbi:Acyl-coenzyme A thioesterase 13 [Fusarium oxysporum f. sp. albedinis]|nr:Acyl-coenzyme A thioesterase 13 [Fusarium oxysporum f. sp. albedinis]
MPSISVLWSAATLSSGKHVPAFAKWRPTSKQASERSSPIFVFARHNHSFAGPPLHRAQSPESSSNGIKTRPINTPSPNTKSTARGRHSSIVDSIDQHAVRALASGH